MAVYFCLSKKDQKGIIRQYQTSEMGSNGTLRLCFAEQLVSGASLEQLRAADSVLLRVSKVQFCSRGNKGGCGRTGHHRIS